MADLWTWAGGATVADLDGDGWLDTLLPVEPGLELYPGGPGVTFDSAGPTVFAEFDLSFASGTTVADYDGDGDLDVYVMRVLGEPIPRDDRKDGHGRNVLLRNDGEAGFVDVTDEAGVDGCGVHHITGVQSCFRTMSSSWGDVDQDGDLDLFVGNYGLVDEGQGVTQEDMFEGEPSFLYLNRGDGTFEDASSTMPPQLHSGYTYAGGFVDLDGDGDLDLYTVNDFGRVAANTVLWNEGGVLTFRQPENSGLEVAVTGMGLGLSDVNRDGYPDLFIPEWGGNVALLSDGQGRWLDFADASGLVADTSINQLVAWGAQTGDVDNDGDTDIGVQYGFLPNDNREIWSNPIQQPDALYLNDTSRDEDGDLVVRFRDVGRNWLVSDPGATRGVVMADLDRDGWLDMVKRNLSGPAVLYVSRCGDNEGLIVHLRQPGTMNHFAVGSTVTVVAAGQRQTQSLLSGGTGYASSPAPELHFGVGPSGIANRVEVTWPDGKRSFLNHVPATQAITITRNR